MTEHHVASLRSYFLVFGALAGLTLLTVLASFVELGPLHLAVALLIAATKGTLVALFFMHLWHARKFLWVVAGAGFFWLAILITLTVSDYFSRGWLGSPLPGLGN